MKLTGDQQVLHHRGNYLVRRQRLRRGRRHPGIAILLSGDGGLEWGFTQHRVPRWQRTLPWKSTVGEVDWSEPSDPLHRAVNVGKEVFEEVVTFFLDRPDAVPQPEDDSN